MEGTNKSKSNDEQVRTRAMIRLAQRESFFVTVRMGGIFKERDVWDDGGGEGLGEGEGYG